jgi:hypothetical protein
MTIYYILAVDLYKYLEYLHVIQYWKVKQFDYPILARIAKDHLAIPATSALSESVFSQGGDIITKKRNRLNKESVQILVCLKD